jgi:hypothetical protein
MMETTHTSSSSATRHVTRDFFVKHPNHLQFFIIEQLLALFGLKTGPRFLCMDQGGELWCSNQLREVAAAAGYNMESTGSNAVSKNVKVERPNGTFGAMVRCLLYGADLSAIFWSAALVRAV